MASPPSAGCWGLSAVALEGASKIPMQHCPAVPIVASEEEASGVEVNAVALVLASVVFPVILPW